MILMMMVYVMQMKLQAVKMHQHVTIWNQLQMQEIVFTQLTQMLVLHVQVSKMEQE